MAMDEFMRVAYEEALQGLREGGIPIGSVLVIDGKVVGRGHNRRVQKGSAILHAEMDCLENAGRLTAADYRPRRSTRRSRPATCAAAPRCSTRSRRSSIGENPTVPGPEDYVRSRGVELVILDDPECLR